MPPEIWAILEQYLAVQNAYVGQRRKSRKIARMRLLCAIVTDFLLTHQEEIAKLHEATADTTARRAWGSLGFDAAPERYTAAESVRADADADATEARAGVAADDASRRPVTDAAGRDRTPREVHGGGAPATAESSGAAEGDDTRRAASPRPGRSIFRRPRPDEDPGEDAQGRRARRQDS